MSIFFVRHIKTVHNTLGLISGRSETEILPNQKLIYDSEAISKLSQILCSPAKRCRETVKLLPKKLQSNICYSSDLAERGMGITEGLSKTEAVKLYPELFFNGKIKVDVKIPDGESIDDVRTRLNKTVKFLKNINDDEHILVCSHNQTLKILFAEMNDIKITDTFWRNLEFQNGKIVNIHDLISLI